MKSPHTTELARALVKFFQEYLPRQKVAAHTRCGAIATLWSYCFSSLHVTPVAALNGCRSPT